MSQTKEEKALLVKWNAGDYSAEGWVNNVDGLTDEALKGLAEYNAKDYGWNFSSPGPYFPPVEIQDVLREIEGGAVAPARMEVRSLIGAPPSKTVVAIIFHDFTPVYKGFRSEFQYPQGMGRAILHGQVSWGPQDVSSKRTSTTFMRDDRNRAFLISSEMPALYRLRFTAPAGLLQFTKLTGVGFYALEITPGKV